MKFIDLLCLYISIYSKRRQAFSVKTFHFRANRQKLFALIVYYQQQEMRFRIVLMRIIQV